MRAQDVFGGLFVGAVGLLVLWMLFDLFIGMDVVRSMALTRSTFRLGLETRIEEFDSITDRVFRTLFLGPFSVSWSFSVCRCGWC